MSFDNRPIVGGAAVTKSDATVLAPTRSLWVGGTGDLTVCFHKAPTAAVALVGVPAGTMLPICVVQVRAATTATDIVALY
jgi:hypothetical protein